MEMRKPAVDIVLIGSSTGGPRALSTVLKAVPKDFPVPIIIAQHILTGYTKQLAVRLNCLCGLNVKEVENGEIVKTGNVYLAVAGKQLITLKDVNGDIRLYVKDDTHIIDTVYKPSVDVLFLSSAEVYGKNILSVVLTGMGKDGLAGVKRIKKLGGRCIAQDQSTSVVYGMPKAVAECGLADFILPLKDIGKKISDFIY